MCRNIRTLFNFSPPATPTEIHDASVQYVRKISGFTNPSTANEKAFEQAVKEVTKSTQKLIDHLTTSAPKKNREEEKRKAQERAKKRFG